MTTVRANENVDLMVIGTGRLACSLLQAITGIAPDECRTLIVGRNLGRTARLAELIGARVSALGRSMKVMAQSADLGNDESIQALFLRFECRCVAIAASSQSPYEKITHPTAWTDLVQDGGYALTVPCNAALPARVARALDMLGSNATLVNGALPDVVNPILVRLTERQLYGFGNVGTIASFMITPDAYRANRKRILAHHVHLSTPADPRDEFCVWDGSISTDPDLSTLAGMRSLPREELNEIAGFSGAALIIATLTGTRLAGHAAGPLGLPGGYPVIIEAGRMTLDLPPGITVKQAVARNSAWARMDGVAEQLDGRIKLTSALSSKLNRILPAAPTEINLRDHAAIRDAEHEFATYREYLRGFPAVSLN